MCSDNGQEDGVWTYDGGFIRGILGSGNILENQCLYSFRHAGGPLHEGDLIEPVEMVSRMQDLATTQ